MQPTQQNRLFCFVFCLFLCHSYLMNFAERPLSGKPKPLFNPLKDLRKNIGLENLPEGMVEKELLAGYLQIDLSNLERVAKNYPGGEGEILSVNTGPISVELWSPQYIKRMLLEIYKLKEEQPNGWENRGIRTWRTSIPFDIRKNDEQVFAAAEKLRTTYPYMFWQMSDKEGKLQAEYYSPELRKMIAIEMKKVVQG